MEIKSFTNYYGDLIKPYGFDLLKVPAKGVRFAQFINNKSEVIFEHSIHFISWGDLDFNLSANNEIITELYNSLEGVVPTDELYLFSANLRTYITPGNYDGFCNRATVTNNQYDFKRIKSEKETEEFAKTIYREIFSKSVPSIIEQTNSIKKIDTLLNLNPPVLDAEGDPKMRVHSRSLPAQLLVALFLAKTLNREDYNELLKIYSGFVNKFSPGEVSNIDVIKKNFFSESISSH
jgi:hypothetical protein